MLARDCKIKGDGGILKKILLIEDEREVLDNISQILTLEGYEVISAANGILGIQFARKHLPDLIICDIMMPEIDGYDVARALKNDPATTGIALIFLSAKADRHDMRLGMETGADDYLTKPFKRDELLKAIKVRLDRLEISEKEKDKRLRDLRNSISLSMPHEMLTPLNVIMGYASILASDYESLEKGEAREMINGIIESGERLSRTIKKFLLYAELEVISTDPEKKGQLLKVSAPFSKKDVSAAAASCAAFYKREDDLEIDISDAFLKAHPDHVKKVLYELIDNAFKYSDPGSRVCIKTFVENNVFTIMISDAGRGMSREYISGIGAYMQFERKFFEQQGSGLGLALSKKVAEFYGGSFKIESDPGKYTGVAISFLIQ